MNRRVQNLKIMCACLQIDQTASSLQKELKEKQNERIIPQQVN